MALFNFYGNGLPVWTNLPFVEIPRSYGRLRDRARARAREMREFRERKFSPFRARILAKYMYF